MKRFLLKYLFLLLSFSSFSQSIDIGIPFQSSNQVTYSAEATALFSAMSVQPSAAQKAVYDYAISTYLVATGTWTELDILHVPYALNETDAKLEWKNPSSTAFRLVPINSPAFVAKSGFTGDGATTYIKTGWIASVNGVKYLRDDASIGATTKDDINENKTILGAYGLSNYIYLVPKTSAFTGLQLAGDVNDVTGIIKPVSSGAGTFTLIRTSSTALEAFQDVSSVGSSVAPTGFRPNRELYYLAFNNDGTASSSSSNTIQMGFAGSHLVTATNMYNFITYLKANL